MEEFNQRLERVKKKIENYSSVAEELNKRTKEYQALREQVEKEKAELEAEKAKFQDEKAKFQEYIKNLIEYSKKIDSEYAMTAIERITKQTLSEFPDISLSLVQTEEGYQILVTGDRAIEFVEAYVEKSWLPLVIEEPQETLPENATETYSENGTTEIPAPEETQETQLYTGNETPVQLQAPVRIFEENQSFSIFPVEGEAEFLKHIIGAEGFQAEYDSRTSELKFYFPENLYRKAKKLKKMLEKRKWGWLSDEEYYAILNAPKEGYPIVPKKVVKQYLINLESKLSRAWGGGYDLKDIPEISTVHLKEIAKSCLKGEVEISRSFKKTAEAELYKKVMEDCIECEAPVIIYEAEGEGATVKVRFPAKSSRAREADVNFEKKVKLKLNRKEYQALKRIPYSDALDVQKEGLFSKYYVAKVPMSAVKLVKSDLKKQLKEIKKEKIKKPKQKKKIKRKKTKKTKK